MAHFWKEIDKMASVYRITTIVIVICEWLRNMFIILNLFHVVSFWLFFQLRYIFNAFT